jgi:hypothetical protein
MRSLSDDQKQEYAHGPRLLEKDWEYFGGDDRK